MESIIVVGASAGGLKALNELLPLLPSSLPTAVLVAQHRAEDGADHLHRILSRRTPLSVCVPVHGGEIQAGCVYVAPPGFHLGVSSGKTCVVERGDRIRRFRPSADELFTSAAAVYGQRTFGIVLSGMLDDGLHGSLEVRRAGGVVIAQEPTTCRAMGMPLSVIGRGVAQFVLPPRAIAHALVSLLMVEGARDLFGVPVKAA